MNGSPTWKITKLMSGKAAAAPSMSQVWVCLDRLRAERHALVHADQVDAQLLGLLEDGERDLRVVHPPRERQP